MARPQPETDQEELGELPPMDGDAEESGEAPGARVQRVKHATGAQEARELDGKRRQVAVWQVMQEEDRHNGIERCLAGVDFERTE